MNNKQQVLKYLSDHPNYVCQCCGGKIQPIEQKSEHSAVWFPYCEHCCKITYGVPREVHQTAKALVADGERYYKHLCQTEGEAKQKNDSALLEYALNEQTGGFADLIMKIKRIENNRK